MDDVESIIIGSSDDDLVVESTDPIVNKRLRKKKKPTVALETIVIYDDESSSTETSTSAQLSLEKNNNTLSERKSNCYLFWTNENKKVCEDNPLLAKLIEKCFELENKERMRRILNKTVMRHYKGLDSSVKKCNEMPKMINKTIMNLENDPYHKFSYLKSLCDTWKLFKKNPFTTLALNSKGANSQRNFNNKKLVTCQNSSTEESLVPVVTIDDDNEDDIVQKLTADVNVNNIVIEDNYEIDCEQEKENQVIDLNCEPCTENIVESTADSVTTTNPCDEHIVPSLVPIEHSEPSLLMRVSKESLVPLDDRTRKINELEKTIYKLRKQITHLEKKEVMCDDGYSPYILCDSLKEKVVKLYNELCQLIGEKPVKKHKVRLQVLRNHPPEPVKILEKFLNNNIGNDGLPKFPDFFDVVKCVEKANKEFSLGWGRGYILKEARALFQHCGMALQKQRKKREWRDLMCMVQIDQVEEDLKDPADDDPDLLARLEQNRLVGSKREADLLKRYTALHDVLTTLVQNTSANNNELMHENDNCNDNMDIHQISIVANDRVTDEISTDIQTLNDSKNILVHNNSKVVSEDAVNIPQISTEASDQVTAEDTSQASQHKDLDNLNSSENILVQEILNVSAEDSVEIPPISTALNNKVTDEDSSKSNQQEDLDNLNGSENILVCVQSEENVEIPKISTGASDKIGDEHTSKANQQEDLDNIDGSENKLVHNHLNVKSEDVEYETEEDIIKLLEELGDNYRVEILEIDGQFLTIELSDDDD